MHKVQQPPCTIITPTFGDILISLYSFVEKYLGMIEKWNGWEKLGGRGLRIGFQDCCERVFFRSKDRQGGERRLLIVGISNAWFNPSHFWSRPAHVAFSHTLTLNLLKKIVLGS